MTGWSGSVALHLPCLRLAALPADARDIRLALAMKGGIAIEPAPGDGATAAARR